MDIEANVKGILRELSGGNGYGEPVFLVAATKTRTVEEILAAIRAGVKFVGENKVQEFRDKYDKIVGAERHFIGNLQSNKIKYLIGKCDLIHSVGSVALGEEISRQAAKKNVVQNILIEVNLGEAQKGGVPFAEVESAYQTLSRLEGLKIRGLMAMLPESDDLPPLSSLCDRMRGLFEELKAKDGNISYLSMGMSGDYRLCLAHGANMVRLGTCIFGERRTSIKI